jgi:hypothetical protein
MNIFIEKQDSKFINNIILTLKHMEKNVFSSDINKDLYKIYYRYPFDVVIFLASKFNNETAQFISEMSSKDIKFFIYHDEELDVDLINSFSNVATHLSHTNDKGVLQLTQMINNYIYKNIDLPRKKLSYAIFLDHKKYIPDELLEILYPNTKLHINMFNSEYVSHYQNLGLISEIDKARILNQYEFFIDIDNNYSAEAVACGAKPITIEQIKNKKKVKNQKNMNMTTYEDFIRIHLI